MPESADHNIRYLATALIALVLGAAGCASVQTHPTQDWVWRTPGSFEPSVAAAPALFEAQGRRGAAAVYRLGHAYAPAQAVAAYRLELQRQGLTGLDDDFDVEAADQSGAWWVIQRSPQGHQRDGLIITTSDATWALSLEHAGDEPEQQIRHTLRELARGISPALRPGLTAAPEISLGEVLSSPAPLELEPPDASGQLRNAAVRTIAAPSTLAAGHALAEPLPHVMSAEDYLDLLLDRYHTQNADFGGEPASIETCGDSCRVATVNAGAWTYILAARTSGDEARHLLMWLPAWADAPELEAPIRRWISDFSMRGDELLKVPTP